ncbi:MAG: methylated-DNA--[protein]-cysteine S-methyltransferase [Bacteroidota bacterium]
MEENSSLFKSFYQTPLGWMEIRCTETAITYLCFTDKEDHVEENPAHPLIQTAIQQLKEYFNGSLTDFDFPVQPEGTVFQEKVWGLLQDIEFGKTLSYLQLSRQFGDEKAIRAVGSANGRNPIAIVIPCHRVIGSDGSLVGYAGKLWRKKWLLDHEHAIISKQLQMQF